jgi:hypothetical protein
MFTKSQNLYLFDGRLVVLELYLLAEGKLLLGDFFEEEMNL